MFGRKSVQFGSENDFENGDFPLKREKQKVLSWWGGTTVRDHYVQTLTFLKKLSTTVPLRGTTVSDFLVSENLFFLL